MPLLVMAAGVGLNRLLPLDNDCMSPSNSAHYGASGYSSVSPSVPASHADDAKVSAGPGDTASEKKDAVSKGVEGRGTTNPSTADVSDSRPSSSSGHIGRRSATAAVLVR